MDSIVELELPSGTKILARKPEAVLLGLWGQSLNLLGVPLETDAASWSDQNLTDVADILRQLLEHCYVQPKISLDRNIPGAIHPLDIPKEDWTFVVRWALAGFVSRGAKPQRRRCSRRPARRRRK